MLVLALLRGNDNGWSSPLIVSLLAGAAVLFGAFLVVERRVSEPMLPLELFGRRAFTVCSWGRSPSRPRSSPCSCT